MGLPRHARARKRGHHGVEERQRQRRAEPAQDGPPRQRFRVRKLIVVSFQFVATCAARIRNAGLSTIPENDRRPAVICAAASRTIFRTAGRS